jgi:hypothetical protein
MRNINSRYFELLTLFARWILNIKTPNPTALTNMFLVLTFLIFFSVLPTSAFSSEETIVIYPTGNYGADVNNIQKAIDKLSASVEGGIIKLKSRNVDGVPTVFNFGTTAVDITKRWGVTIVDGQLGPIVIRGEYDEHEDDEDEDNDKHESYDDSMDEPQTVILGGYIPIRMYGGGELTIEHIKFQEAGYYAIYIGASDSITIKNNFFLDTITDMSFPRVIRIRGLGDDVNQITGRIVIKDNVIDKAFGYFSDGIAIYNTNAETTVTNNEISGVNVGIRLNNYAQAFKAVGNNISVHVPAPNYFAAGFNGSCGIGGSPAVTIEDNLIEARDDTGLGGANGISVYARDWLSTDCEMSNVEIKHNSIELTNAITGITVSARGYADSTASFVRNRIVENSISGNALGGIELYAELFDPDATTTLEASKNKFLRNNLQDLDAEIADIYLWELTSNNLVVAYPDDVVIDEGENNRVIILSSDDEDDDDE